METLRTTCQLTAFLFILFIAGCKPEPIVVDPPDPPTPPVTYPDCSHSFTEPALDTNAAYPGGNPLPGATTTYYEGYKIIDFKFNPENPNVLMILLKAFDSSICDAGGTDIDQDYHVWQYSLCSGEETLLFSTQRTIDAFDVNQKGQVLIAYNSYNPYSYAYMNSDGTNYTPIMINNGGNLFVHWSDSVSFYARTPWSKVQQFSLEGGVLSVDIGLPTTCRDIDILADGRLAFSTGTGGSIYDPSTNSISLIDEYGEVLGSNQIAYSSHVNSIVWSADSIVYDTHIETLERSQLEHGFIGHVHSEVECTSNGYIAYLVETTSHDQTVFPNNPHVRTELRFINADGTDERRLVLDFE